MTNPAALVPSVSALQNLVSLRAPAGMSFEFGGTRGVPLSFSLPPRLSLRTDDRYEILQMLNYAGVSYRPESEAARFGIHVFRAGRNFTRRQTFDRISFDWDHTLSNYQIFEHLPGLLKARSLQTPPPTELDQTPMTAIEVARPFMHELVLGMMVGFATHQGLKTFDQWEHYEPQVALATHTWPDRLGILASFFIRLLPLMGGLLPGSPHLYEKITDEGLIAITHLHHFLHYADQLMVRYEQEGFEPLTPRERTEVMNYLEDGKAHYRKPIGALEERGFAGTTLLHFDDSTKIISDFENGGRNNGRRIRGVWVKQSHSRFFADVQEWHKISLPAFWRSRQAAAEGVVEHLAHIEDRRSPIPAVLSALKVFSGDEDTSPDPSLWLFLPQGVMMAVHETPTTVGEYWRYYVNPTNRSKANIRRIREARGGLRAIRKAFHSAP